MGLSLLNTPSSHILKPDIDVLEGIVCNEGFCLNLARNLNLATAKADIKTVAGKTYLLVERYDRHQSKSGHFQRLHQEDFCQALGVAPEYKYQNEGGPNIAQCFELLRVATRPSAPHIIRFFDYVIFNTLIGNHDAHAKNFSLLYSSKGTQLAPLYDALSTAVYPDLTGKMAMKIGSKYRFKDIFLRHWDRLAEVSGLSPAQARKRVLEIARQLPQLAHELQETFRKQEIAHPILGKIITLIEERCEITTRRITGLPTEKSL
jgi:serine/threonine-protein kinase HipA